MSKERLEEINRFIRGQTYDRLLVPNTVVNIKYEDYKLLYEKAERVQELERANKQLKNNLSVYKGYYKNTLKHNKELIERVRELEDEE